MQHEEVLVAGNQDLCCECEGEREHPVVVGIATGGCVERGSVHPRRRRTEQRDHLGQALARDLEFVAEHTDHLALEVVVDPVLVGRKHTSEQLRAGAAGGQGGHQDVGIQPHLHDMDRNTSSSDTMPAASAYGMSDSRTCWNWRSAR